MTQRPERDRYLFDRFEGLLHGADYNPEQWRHRPEVLEQDPRLMREANMNGATLAVFGWAALEPQPDVLCFDWLDLAFERLLARDVRVILATPSGARPRWLAEAHPDVMRTRRDGTRVAPGQGRHNSCPSSPLLRERVTKLNEALARRYGHHPALLAWHIGNELGGDEDGARCYCARCVAGFQRWLEQRYAGDLEALNRAWWTSFWSHNYDSWAQIRPGDISIEALELNYRRYQSALVIESCRDEIAAIRRHSQAPATTNMFGNLAHYDHGQLAQLLDFTSFDGYPVIDGTSGDGRELAKQCFYVDAVRSWCRARPWLLMESCPSVPQWHALGRLKRPGVQRALSLTMVGRGSDGVCYFQWRAGRGGMEKLHGAVVMQEAPHDSRVFREVQALGAELEQLRDVAGSTVPATTAVVWDVESEWARELCSGLSSMPLPQASAMDWHSALLGSGYGVDVVDGASDLGRYRLLIVPGVFLLRKGFAEALTSAAKSGAQVLVDGLSAWVDEDLACMSEGRPGPLSSALGLRAEELDQLRDDERVSLSDPAAWLGERGQARGWIDRVIPGDCEVLVEATGDFHAGWPLLTRKACGAGAFWYLASGLWMTAREHLLAKLCARCGLQPALRAIPSGVIVSERSGRGRSFLFLVNANPASVTLTLPAGCRDAKDDRPLAETLELAGWECRVVQTPRGTP